jgi:hypothetical protein
MAVLTAFVIIGSIGAFLEAQQCFHAWLLGFASDFVACPTYRYPRVHDTFFDGGIVPASKSHA